MTDMKNLVAEIDMLVTERCHEAYGEGRGDGYEHGYKVGRRAALEEAAIVCEVVSEQYQEREQFKHPKMKTDAETGANDCVLAISAIVDKEES